MRGLRSTLVLLLVLVGIVSYIYFVEIERRAPLGRMGKMARINITLAEAQRSQRVRFGI